jgi:CRISPR/Cas system-associated exonuclease Cas4 (RecB family)
MKSFFRIFFKYLAGVFVLCLLANADETVRKKMKIDLTKSTYIPKFNIDQYATYKGKAIYVSAINGEDKEEYYSDDKKIKYNVDDLEDYFENWIKLGFEHAGLLVQEPVSFWQRAFQPSISISVNQSQSMTPKGMLDFRVNITKYSESNSEISIEGYIDGRITFKETIPVTFSSPPITADKEFLTNNAFTNLDIMTEAILNNAKFRESIENTNK